MYRLKGLFIAILTVASIIASFYLSYILLLVVLFWGIYFIVTNFIAFNKKEDDFKYGGEWRNLDL